MVSKTKMFIIKNVVDAIDQNKIFGKLAALKKVIC